MSFFVDGFLGDDFGGVEFVVDAGDCLVALREPAGAQQLAFDVADVFGFVTEDLLVLIVFRCLHAIITGTDNPRWMSNNVW